MYLTSRPCWSRPDFIAETASSSCSFLLDFACFLKQFLEKLLLFVRQFCLPQTKIYKIKTHTFTFIQYNRIINYDYYIKELHMHSLTCLYSEMTHVQPLRYANSALFPFNSRHVFSNATKCPNRPYLYLTMTSLSELNTK